MNINRIIAEPKSFDTLKLDQKWFVISQLASEYKKTGAKLVPILSDIMVGTDVDIAITLANMCYNVNKTFLNQLSKYPNGMQVAQQLVNLYKED